ncbi:DoxX family protein [Bradyrhizobium sp. U87765 SZCCT0131]|uniref:DoxX family protein n=1 Tax=unclassified Bradyrhizobium TaxID=2631580 RepID=UPI001BABD4FE|nr:MULTISPECIES: DoxX family protein [unclassified Bradyrhizobium]MBR1220472.1 DoxX family protein [Bradyrhizobium sp. U87765 SZCCT0131]MBR1263073.1 DoxX family protein [Bradyrhizobium sp. U87765 SZCCT0134]MBR1307044.1 DoxX family protein [Bradyrhizobium sp. U87765 SZCCT0110]MBR1323068.1 DoxX family protein [Bradyrhizobium sp. U87765 SZCCT0109]MBR1345998.1 DoxX family protein [Bradyrhizobium sp. U87765 SZCCT0048]
MSGIVAIGRILFAVLFVFSGVSNLVDLAATAQDIATKVAIPAALTAYTTQLESLTGMPIAQQLAISASAIEIICGLMIALNFGARFFAIILIMFVMVATFYNHNFWDLTGAERVNQTMHALKNLSLIGALLIIVGYPRRGGDGIAYAEH